VSTGNWCPALHPIILIKIPYVLDWDKACSALANVLELPEDTALPAFPKAQASAKSGLESTTSATKRKAPDGDVEMIDNDSTEKRTKSSEGEDGTANNEGPSAAALASFFGVLDQDSMQPPVQPTKEELEKILLDVRKRSLLAQYDV
jgi:pre-mRNA-splicing factor ISY1